MKDFPELTEEDIKKYTDNGVIITFPKNCMGDLTKIVPTDGTEWLPFDEGYKKVKASVDVPYCFYCMLNDDELRAWNDKLGERVSIDGEEPVDEKEPEDALAPGSSIRQSDINRLIAGESNL